MISCIHPDKQAIDTVQYGALLVDVMKFCPGCLCENIKRHHFLSLYVSLYYFLILGQFYCFTFHKHLIIYKMRKKTQFPILDANLQIIY